MIIEDFQSEKDLIKYYFYKIPFECRVCCDCLKHALMLFCAITAIRKIPYLFTMDSAEQKILNGYYALIQGLTQSMKLNLIERLKESIKSPKVNVSQIEDAFGSWHSNESSEELIDIIRSSRRINRQPEEF